MNNKIEWIVPNFIQLIAKRNTKEIRFETKPSGLESGRDETTLSLKMELLGRYNTSYEIYFLVSNSAIAIYKLSLYRPNSQEYVLQEQKEATVFNRNEWHFICVINKSASEQNYLLANGSLRLKLLFSVKDVVNQSNVLCNVDSCNQLCDDFKSLFSSDKLSDIVTIKCKEGYVFNVHKEFISRRSEVLKANFVHNTTECETNIVETCLETEVLIEILTFIYCNKAPGIHKIPKKLLAAADYYQLDLLKSLCEEVLYEQLTVDNAIDTLLLANLHSADTLKQLTLEFLKNNARLVVKTKGWARVTSVEVLKAFCECILHDVEYIKPIPKEQSDNQGFGLSSEN